MSFHAHVLVFHQKSGPQDHNPGVQHLLHSPQRLEEHGGPRAPGHGQQGQGGAGRQSAGAHTVTALSSCSPAVAAQGHPGKEARSGLIVKHSAHVLWQLDLSKVTQ